MKLSELAARCWSGSVSSRNSNLAIAVAIALAESGGKLDATHTNSDGSVDRGPWQVNSVHGFDAHKLTTDPEYTVDAACKVYSEQGWAAWTTYKNGAYLKFLGKDADLTSGGSNIGGAIVRGAESAIPGVGPLLGVPGVNIPNPVSAVDSIAHVVSALANPSTYLRLGKGALGGVFVIAGAGAITFIIANKSGAGKAVTKAAKIAAI